MKSISSPVTRWLAGFQGVYFLTTAIWPLVHMPSFIAMTGPKVDLWLVDTVAVLVGAIGVSLLAASWRQTMIALETRLLAILSAAGLAWIDFHYTSIGRIWPVYALDGLAETALILGWVVVSMRDYKMRV